MLPADLRGRFHEHLEALLRTEASRGADDAILSARSARGHPANQRLEFASRPLISLREAVDVDGVADHANAAARHAQAAHLGRLALGDTDDRIDAEETEPVGPFVTVHFPGRAGPAARHGHD